MMLLRIYGMIPWEIKEDDPTYYRYGMIYLDISLLCLWTSEY